MANDVRGRYASEGTWRLLVDDPEDGYDVVEWIAAQPWSDGKVGTFGTSYPGGTQHALAEMKPAAPDDHGPHRRRCRTCGISGMRHGGAFELRFMNWIFSTGAANSRAALADPALKAALTENGRRIREHVDNLPVRPGTTPLKVVPEYEAWLVEAMRSGPESPFWKVEGDVGRRPRRRLRRRPRAARHRLVRLVDPPGHAQLRGARRRRSRAPQRLTIGPWVHGSQGSNVSGEVEFTPDAAIDLLAFRLRWYDRWLKGKSNGVDDDPPVLLYIMGTGDDRKSPAGRLQHGGSWRAEREWPLSRARPTPYYLQGDGTLVDSTPPSVAHDRTTYTFDPRHPVPTIGGNISSNTGLMTNGGYDQRPRDDTHAAENRLPLSERRDVLVFRTEPLAEDLEVTGTVQVKLWVASTAPDTDFTAKLIDEIPRQSRLSPGLRPEHRRLDPAGPLPRVARPARARWSPARSSR